MHEEMNWKENDWLLKAAIEEDHARDDRTTSALIPDAGICEAKAMTRETGIICGLTLAQRLCEIYDRRIRMECCYDDGEDVRKGTCVASLQGPASSILSIERTLLNFLQRLSGISTLTHTYVETIKGTGAQILDTRKTTPGWRALEKYAVRCGGGTNHRKGLHDQILIKENHIAIYSAHLCESRPEGKKTDIADVIASARKAASGLKVEIEVENIDQFQEALSAEPDIILLDNFLPAEISRAVAIRGRRQLENVLLEASGNITLETVKSYAETGVERISAGALTHSASAMDISLDIDFNP